IVRLGRSRAVSPRTRSTRRVPMRTRLSGYVRRRQAARVGPADDRTSAAPAEEPISGHRVLVSDRPEMACQYRAAVASRAAAAPGVLLREPAHAERHAPGHA